MDINVINKDNLPTASIKDFKPLQGSLKTLSDENYNKLKKSIEKYGFFVPIFVWNGYIMDGHGRREVIIGEGWNIKVPYINIEAKDVDEAKDKLLHITSQYNTITIEGLQEFNPNWGELSINFDAISISKEEPKLEAKEDDFDATPPSEPKTVLGDIYEIGEHRLLCGDSTDIDQVEKLMNEGKADIAFTSPPYNVGTTPTEVKMRKTSKYANDDDNKSDYEYLELLTDFTNNTLLFSEYSFVNIQSLSGNKIALIDYLYNLKSVYADTIIWNKQNAQPAMANNVLNSQFEYVHIFSHKANRAIGTKEFRGTISNVLDIQKQTKNKVKEHNATFPIEFVSFFITNFCDKSVLDLFLGSGTTMVASHQLKRKCYGMELDPKYCDVIVTRMLKLDPSLTIKRNGEVIEW